MIRQWLAVGALIWPMTFPDDRLCDSVDARLRTRQQANLSQPGFLARGPALGGLVAGPGVAVGRHGACALSDRVAAAVRNWALPIRGYQRGDRPYQCHQNPSGAVSPGRPCCASSNLQSSHPHHTLFRLTLQRTQQQSHHGGVAIKMID